MIQQYCDELSVSRKLVGRMQGVKTRTSRDRGRVWIGLGDSRNSTRTFSDEEFSMYEVLNEVYLRNFFRDGRNFLRRN